MSVSYYPPKGGAMSVSITEVSLIALAVAAWVYVLFGANLV